MDKLLKKFLGAATVLVLVAALLPATGVAFAGKSAPPTLTTLQPGGFRSLEQDLTVNVVFVGYEQGAGYQDIDETAFLAGLPASYRTINRYPYFYGNKQFLGVDFTYDYNLVFADTAFEDAFFGYLDTIKVSKPLSLTQVWYNVEANRSLDITENYWIDAPSVEQWLADNTSSMIGVDTSQYTIFFINWYSRPDFKFHVYTKTDEPDPDTGYNFGELRESRKVIAWGGTTPDDEESGLGSLHRIWFYDLSAGPDYWTDNYAIDAAPGYTMPPIWEYGNMAGYRPFDDLSGDLGKVARYVAIDLLFTTSPLYKPALSPPKLPETVQVDINLYQIDPSFDATTLFDTDLIPQELGELLAHNSVSVDLAEAPFKSRAEDVYNCFIIDISCYGSRLFGIAFGDLFLYHNDHLIDYLDGDADYEVPVFGYYDSEPFAAGGLLGFADDDWATGTQSYVFAFDDPALQASGYGFSSTVIHEVGHHIGMSHPHDGYDYETDTDFGPDGDFYFAWSGDESNTIMSYIDLNWDFSQFDRDNMNRYMTAIYLNQANAILADIYASSKAAQAGSLLTSADNHAAQALTAYAAMDYAGAAMHAKLAYLDVLAAAAQINVKVEPQSWQADYKAKGESSKFVDSVDYQRSKP